MTRKRFLQEMDRLAKAKDAVGLLAHIQAWYKELWSEFTLQERHDIGIEAHWAADVLDGHTDRR